jgi:hypothetical protein
VLGISTRTAEHHKYNLKDKDKGEVRSSAELTQYGLEQGSSRLLDSARPTSKIGSFAHLHVLPDWANLYAA